MFFLSESWFFIDENLKKSRNRKHRHGGISARLAARSSQEQEKRHKLLIEITVTQGLMQI